MPPMPCCGHLPSVPRATNNPLADSNHGAPVTCQRPPHPVRPSPANNKPLSDYKYDVKNRLKMILDASRFMSLVNYISLTFRLFLQHFYGDYYECWLACCVELCLLYIAV